MKILDKSYSFTLNGVQERVICRPKTRDEPVTMTMNGSQKHATSMSLEDFESVTGHTFFDIAPESDQSESQIIEAARKHLADREAIALDAPHCLIAAHIRFSNARAACFTVRVSIIRSASGLYLGMVTKASGSHGTRVATLRCNNLEILTQNALELFDGFISGRVQILSAVVDRGVPRETDQVGVVKLFKNESVKEYFANQQMPAGVVINQKGRYQVFSSYVGSSGANHIDHDTKDYASLKNATKALREKGFDIKGRQLAVLDCKDAEEEIRQVLGRFCPSSSDTFTAQFESGQGSYSVSRVLMDEDEALGAFYRVELTYTHEASGETLRTNVPINPRGDGTSVHVTGYAICSIIASQQDQLTRGELIFDPDTRSLAQRQQHHLERIKALDKLLDHYKRTAAEPGHWQENARQTATSLGARIYEHTMKSMSIGKLIAQEPGACDMNEP